MENPPSSPPPTPDPYISLTTSQYCHHTHYSTRRKALSALFLAGDGEKAARPTSPGGAGSVRRAQRRLESHLHGSHASLGKETLRVVIEPPATDGCRHLPVNDTCDCTGGGVDENIEVAQIAVREVEPAVAGGRHL